MILRCLILFQIIHLGHCSLSLSELNISLSLMKHLNIHQCILTTDELDFSTFKTAKTFGHSEIFTTYKTNQEFKNYMLNGDDLDFKRGKRPCLYPWSIAVIWKTDVQTFNTRLNAREFKYRPSLTQYNWIFIVKSGNFLNIQIHIPFDCQFLIVERINETDYEIFEMYRGSASRIVPDTYVKYFGSWNKDEGLKAKEEYIYWRRMDFHGSVVSLYTGDNAYFHTSLVLSKQWEFWTEMARILNFTTQVVTYKDFKKMPNTDKILDHNIGFYFDGSLNLQAWTSRLYTSCVIAPFWIQRVYMHVKYELDDMSDLRSLLKPFSTRIWIFVSAAIIFSSLLILMTEYFVIKMLECSKIFFNFEKLFTPLQLLLNQGENLRKNLPNKIIILSLSILALTLLPSYTGMVVSFLTLKKPKIPFENLEGFIKDGRYQLNGVNDSYIISHFAINKDGNPLYKLIYEKYFVNPAKMVTSLPDGVDEVCKGGKIVLLSYNNEALLPEFESKCKLLRISEPIFSVMSAMPTSAIGGYQEIFNHIPVGIYQKMTKEIYGTIAGLNNPQDKFIPVVVSQIVPAASILVAGILLSLLILFCELFWVCIRRKIKQKAAKKQERHYCWHEEKYGHSY